MVSVHGYNQERNESSYGDIYFKAIMCGIVGAAIVILGGIGTKFFLKLIIEYWAWGLGTVMFLIVVKKLYLDRRKNEKHFVG